MSPTAEPQTKTRLDVVMRERGITNERLGVLIDRKPRQVSAYRNGRRPPVKTQDVIARVLGLGVEELWPE